MHVNAGGQGSLVLVDHVIGQARLPVLKQALCCCVNPGPQPAFVRPPASKSGCCNSGIENESYESGCKGIRTKVLRAWDQSLGKKHTGGGWEDKFNITSVSLEPDVPL